MTERAATARRLQDELDNGVGPVEAGLIGQWAIRNDPTAIQTADLEHAQTIGIPVALLLLVLALGSIVAAAVAPIALAVAGLLFAVGTMFALMTWMAFDSLVMARSTMIGVGVDHAMFVVSRFREELARARVTRKGRKNRVTGRKPLFWSPG